MTEHHKTPALFTPLFEPAIEKYGVIAAAVFGEAWRYAQMTQGMCVAAKETIAANLGICLRTVVSCFALLCDGEYPYLRDLTPDVRNRPHAYVDTGQCRIDAENGVQEMHSTMQEMHTDDGNGMQEMHGTMQEMHTGMQNLRGRYAGNAREESIKREEEETSQETVPLSLGDPPPPLQRKTLLPSEIPKADPVFQEQWTDVAMRNLRMVSSKAIYEMWYLPITPIARVNGTAYLAVSEHYEQHWALGRLKLPIERALCEACGEAVGFQFIVLPPGGT